MKTKKVSLEQLLKIYSHPSAALFRSIELKTVYEKASRFSFREPSLDLGCGDGKISSLLFDTKFTYGVDNGEANDIQIAIKEKVYNKVLIESAEKMSLPDESVNFVFSNSVIEHIPDNEAVLSEVSRILKKKGDFVFTCPSHLFGKYLFLSSLFKNIRLGFLANLYAKKRNRMLNHYHLYSQKVWEKKLANHGLKLKNYAYYINKKTLNLWDQLALKIFMLRKLDKKIETKLLNRYRPQLFQLYHEANPSKTEGASLFLHAVKI